MQFRLRRRGVAVLAATALIATACSGGEEDGGDDPDPAASTPTDGGETTGAMEVMTDVGVTSDPCPDAVNADNGCIYLGIISDLTEGPFAPLGVEIVAGQEAFWRTVNEEGGLGGYDIDVTTYTRDNKYNNDEHVAQYQAIEGDVLALAQSLGTPTTLAALSRMKDDNVLALPASWWSGWAFEDYVLDSGYSYCVEAMNGLDYANDVFVEGGVESVMSVFYPNDYGLDSSAGVAAWAAANEIEFDAEADAVPTGPNAQVGDQSGPIAKILAEQPSVVMLATGPLEAAEIMGGAASQGYQGRFIGAVPTWNPALLGNPDLAAVLPIIFRHVGPWGAFGSDTVAHDKMAAALNGELPGNDGYTFGWIWSYPMKAAIEQAVANGDLTRAGLVAASLEMTVDYEGALPARQYGNGGADAVKTSIISVPDPDAPLGLTEEQGSFTGPTAEAFSLDAPCSDAG